MAETNVTEKNKTEVSTIMADMAEFAGEGMDIITADDMQIPFVRILQALSPEIQKNDPKFIKGASAGDLVNTVTGQIWEGDDGLVVIPCGYTMKYLEFGLRESGGGFQGEIPSNHPDIANTTRDGANEVLPSGNELVRSAQHLVMIVDMKTGATQQAICDMKKTQLKVSRRWNTQMKMVQYQGANGLFNPPMWGTAWKLITVSESNDRGTWYNYSVSRVEPGDVPGQAFSAARSFFQSFKSGDVQTSAGTSEEMQNPAKSNEDTDDIPF
jgi:hypothetical protein